MCSTAHKTHISTEKHERETTCQGLNEDYLYTAETTYTTIYSTILKHAGTVDIDTENKQTKQKK